MENNNQTEHKTYIPDWELVAKKLLWCHFVDNKHEKSGWFQMNDGGEPQYGLNFSSIVHPSQYHALTWKDLMWEWGVMPDAIMSDTHDCTKCPKRDTCESYFKDNKDQEQCSYWTTNVDPTLQFIADWDGHSNYIDQEWLNRLSEEHNKQMEKA